MTTQFLPQVQHELGNPLQVSFLVLPDYMCALRHEAVSAATQPNRAVQLASFLDEGRANSWLRARHLAG